MDGTVEAGYTHRVAISNHRLVAVTDDSVSFRWKDYRHGDQIRTLRLDVDERPGSDFFPVYNEGRDTSSSAFPTLQNRECGSEVHATTQVLVNAVNATSAGTVPCPRTTRSDWYRGPVKSAPSWNQHTAGRGFE